MLGAGRQLSVRVEDHVGVRDAGQDLQEVLGQAVRWLVSRAPVTRR